MDLFNPCARLRLFDFRGVQYLLQRKKHHFHIRKIAQKYFTVETAKPPIKSGVSWAISFSLPIDGRGDRIRTCDPLVPNQMRYQAALRLENLFALLLYAENLLLSNGKNISLYNMGIISTTYSSVAENPCGVGDFREKY